MTVLYLDDFADEIMPVSDCSAQGWANWLAGPDAEWGRDEAAKDGDQFPASVMLMGPDIIATRSPDGWLFSREPEAAPTLLACRFAEGLGWSPESINGSMTDLRQWLVDNDEFCDAVEYVAIGYDQLPNMTTFRLIDGKPTLELEPVL